MWILFAICMLVFALSFLVDDKIDEYNSLLEKYNVNSSNGDKLIKCENGSYGVLKKHDKNLCGNIIIEPPKNNGFEINIPNKK